ncbi:MAG: aminotransferase class V-fold PLP-dependent enzyme, partial [Desulforhabdus sp.]|nr:aminotransferase class V-fold PLP-dependent enzyme [Desulforhabdus sp.]
MTVYLDNAATSYPKPKSVYRMVDHALRNVGASPGRGSYRQSREASAMVEAARNKVARLFDIPRAEQVFFTKNATESINIVLKGWLRPGDRVVISSMEHNSVIRPLRRLSEGGVEVEIVQCNANGHLEPEALQKHLSPPPRLIVLVHASNVNGALQPVAEIANLCSEHDVPLLLDAAQTGGIQPISASGLNLGMLACSGHKGLLGPPGIGILYIRPGLSVSPLIEGGTGSRSEQDFQPELCPDRYESGTPNLPGIAALAAGIEFIQEKGIAAIREHELRLATLLEKKMAELPAVRVYAPEVRGSSAVSFTVEGINPADLGYLLDQGFDIAVRTGLHCAPMAHQTLGTFPEGTVRVSPGYFTTETDIVVFLSAMQRLLSQR